MRLAFVVGSSYERNGQLLPLSSAEIDSQYLARRLGLDDIRTTVVELPAERGVAERLEQALSDQPGPVESVLVVFVGYGVFSKERGPALLLDGERLGTFSFVRLRSLLERYSTASCVIAEVMMVGEGQEDLAAVADAIAGALTDKHARGTSGLIALRQSDSSGAEPVLAATLVTALDWLSASGSGDRALPLSALFEAMRSDDRFQALPLIKLVPGNPPFAVGGSSGESAAAPAPIPAFPPVAVREPSAPPAPAPAMVKPVTPPPLPIEAPTMVKPVTPPPLPIEAPAMVKPVTPPPLPIEAPSATSETDPPPESDLDTPVPPTRERLKSGEELLADTPPPALERASSKPSIQPLPLPSSPPVKHPTLTPPPPLPGMRQHQSVNVAMAVPVAAPSRPPPPAPADAAALFADTSAVVPKREAGVELSDGALRASGYRPTVAVTPPSEIYGDEAPPSDALPSFGGATMTADELLANADFEAAVQEYEAALLLLDDAGERASALARLARALLGLNRNDDAEARYREALETQARHPEVLCTRAELDAAANDMDALLLSAEAWVMRAPEHPRAIELLGKAAEATGDVRRGIDARRGLARHALSPAERAEVFLECSRTAETEISDEALALALALEGLELAPSHLGLLDRTRDLLDRAGRGHELLAYYERAMSQILDPDSASAISQRIERLAGEAGAEPSVAVAALERLIEARPGEAGLRFRVAELHATLGDLPRATQHCRAALKLTPDQPEGYRRLHGLFERAGNSDGAFNACAVLEALGEADIDESLIATQHRPEGLLPVRGVVTDADWNESLFLEDGERDLLTLFGALAFLGPIACRVGLAQLKEKKRTFEPDPTTFQDPEKSTTMLAKTLGWSSRLLSLGVPELYVLPELAAGIDVAPLENGATLASRSLGSGLEIGELAFLWGRKLPWLRPELRALSFFRTRTELASFVTALLALAGARGVDTKAFDKDTKRVHSALKRELKGVDFSRLKSLAAKIPPIEVAARAERLMRMTELTGVRAGLLLVGDVAKAADLIRRFPTEGLTRAEDQLAELYTFAVSEAYARLRERLGIGA